MRNTWIYTKLDPSPRRGVPKIEGKLDVFLSEEVEVADGDVRWWQVGKVLVS